MVLLLSGCSYADAANIGAEELRAQFEADYPEHLERMEIQSPSGLFGGGHVWAAAWLGPDTPEEVLDAALADLEAFEASHVSFFAAGVVANGVGICAADPQREAKRELRAVLAERGLSLAGAWGCSLRPDTPEQAYEGSLAELIRDTELVQSVGLGSALTLTAELREPFGTVTGDWLSLPVSGLAAAVAVAEAELDLARVDWDGARLTLTVQPTTDVTEVAAAAQQAAGPQIEVLVRNGADGGAAGAASGPLADALRAVPGVTGVQDGARGLMVRVSDAEVVVPALAAGADQDRFIGTDVQVIPASAPTDSASVSLASRYVKPAGAAAGDPTGWLALLQVDGLRDVTWTVPVDDGIPTVQLALDQAGLGWTVEAKPLIPEGSQVRLTGLHDWATVEFGAAALLSEEDVSAGPITWDASALVEAWNGAGP